MSILGWILVFLGIFLLYEVFVDKTGNLMVLFGDFFSGKQTYPDANTPTSLQSSALPPIGSTTPVKTSTGGIVYL